VIRECEFLIPWINYLNVEMKEGLRGQSHLRWDNYEDDFLLYGRDVKTIIRSWEFLSSVYNEKCIGAAPCNEIWAH
jgi:hypothetical protein